MSRAAALLAAAIVAAGPLAPAPVAAEPWQRPGATVLASRGVGDAAATHRSEHPAVTADGRLVLFTSEGRNLTAEGSNIYSQIYASPVDGGPLFKASVGSDGAEGDNLSQHPAVSADGQVIAFGTAARNFYDGHPAFGYGIYTHDRAAGETSPASIRSSDGQLYRGNDPAISGDGRVVAFTSDANRIVGPDEPLGSIQHVYLHDRSSGETTRASLDVDGEPADDSSGWPQLDHDARYLVFASRADLTRSGITSQQIYRRDLLTGEVELVSVGEHGEDPNGLAYSPTVSADGQRVAFLSTSTNLVPSGRAGLGGAFVTLSGRAQVYVRDLTRQTTERVSVTSAGEEADDDSLRPAISPDGRFVAFSSRATNLTEAPTGGEWHVFLHDRDAGVTELVSVDSQGSPADGPSGGPAVAGDGTVVAFESDAANLVVVPTFQGTDVYARVRGRPLDALETTATASGGTVQVTGTVAAAGGVVSAAEQEPAADGLARAAGGALRAASIVHRPQHADVLVRIRPEELPSVGAPPVQSTYWLPRLGGLAAVEYRMSFVTVGVPYEIRAFLGTELGSGGRMTLHRCDTDGLADPCEQVADLAGGIGTTGTEVRVALPLSLIGGEASALTDVRVVSAPRGARSAEPFAVLDLPDAPLQSPTVAVALAPPGTSPADVTPSTPASLAGWRFAAELPHLGAPAEAHVDTCFAGTCARTIVPVEEIP